MHRFLLFLFIFCAGFFSLIKPAQALISQEDYPGPTILAWNTPPPDKHPFLKHGDQLQVMLVVDRALNPGQNIQFEAVVGPFIIILNQEGPAVFRGKKILVRQGIYLNREPADVFILKGDKRIHMGKMGTFFIDTVIPQPTKPRVSYVDQNRIRLNWEAEGLTGNETFILQHKKPSGMVENIIELQDPQHFEQIVSLAGGAYRLVAVDPAGNTGRTEWIKPKRHIGCFPVWMGGNLTKYTFCVSELPFNAALTGYSGCKLVEKKFNSNNRHELGLVYECSRFGVDLREKWVLKFLGPERGWTGSMTRTPLIWSRDIPSRETVHVRAWWNR